ncbi:glycosyltransferase family 2 protein [Burkholderia multivorans]|uniref:glycosyltransferase family 2 protein n=2 Tax=Burkholderia multivorans TaxID=87883 RepID=UPI0035A25C6D
MGGGIYPQRGVAHATDGASVVLSVSVVVYRPASDQLMRTLTSLVMACHRLRARGHPGFVTVCVVDNGDFSSTDDVANLLRMHGIPWHLVSGQGNVGFGRGHNLSLLRTYARYHLILNPDIDLDEDALVRAIEFMDAHPDVGLLTPWIGDQFGKQQFLCRRYPALLDLLVRGFMPAGLRAHFCDRLAHYEMRDVINDHDIVWDPPIVSGCFMLFRTEVLKKLGGFDPRYFLYFEDYDLSLRTHDVARVAYVPSVRVIHHGGGASRKGFAHIRMFAASAFKFYNRFGWRLW